MKQMDNVTYIFPVLEIGDEQQKKLILGTINSVKAIYGPDDSIVVVGPKDVIEGFDGKIEINDPDVAIEKVVSEGADVYSLINDAVMDCTTEYFSIIEPGETYSRTWAKNAEAYGKGCSVILPLVRNISNEGEQFLSNELAWSVSFNEESGIGFVTMDFLDKFIDLSLSGGYFNTEDFISVGKFKPSMKIVAWYEFLLRCAHRNRKIYVVPKIGIERPYKENGEEISKGEVDWLIKTARQEYFFKEDREKKFEEKGE